MKAHFEKFSSYNQWANTQLYAAAADLSTEEKNRNLDGFFTSLLHTLNHILVADLIWMERLEGARPKPESLDTILCRNLSELASLRADTDQRLIQLTRNLTAEQLQGFLDYKTSKGVACHDRISEIMTHVFNHQTHHRGQCHHMLSQLGKSPPPLDMMYFFRARD